MKRYAFLTVLGLALGLLGPAAALADQANPSTDGKPGYHQKFQQKFQEKLGLTDDQMTRIREVWQRQRDSARPVFQALRVANTQLRELALYGAKDDAIQAKLAEIEGLQGQALQLRVATLREIAPLLTDEQKQKLAQMSPMGGRHHRRPAPAPTG